MVTLSLSNSSQKACQMFFLLNQVAVIYLSANSTADRLIMQPKVPSIDDENSYHEFPREAQRHSI